MYEIRKQGPMVFGVFANSGDTWTESIVWAGREQIGTSEFNRAWAEVIWHMDARSAAELMAWSWRRRVSALCGIPVDPHAIEHGLAWMTDHGDWRDTAVMIQLGVTSIGEHHMGLAMTDGTRCVIVSQLDLEADMLPVYEDIASEFVAGKPSACSWSAMFDDLVDSRLDCEGDPEEVEVCVYADSEDSNAVKPDVHLEVIGIGQARLPAATARELGRQLVAAANVAENRPGGDMDFAAKALADIASILQGRSAPKCFEAHPLKIVEMVRALVTGRQHPRRRCRA